MVDHLIERDGQRGLVAGHHVGCRITHQYYIHARTIDDPGHAVIISREHGNFFAPVFHLPELMGGDFFYVLRLVS
jgi:hypothetical protein